MTQSCERIVSLLPSATEWLGILGYSNRLVGISHECDEPSDVMHLPRVTASRVNADHSSRDIDQQVKQYCEAQESLYQLDVSCLASLRPDLIVTQSLCGVCAISQRDVADVAERLACRVVDLHAQTFKQVLDDGATLAQVVGTTDASQRALDQLRSRVDQVKTRSSKCPGPRPRLTLLEWTDPLFCSGHWTPELIQWAGGHDPLGQTGIPSRQITFDELQRADPDLLLVACCGMSLDRTRKEWEKVCREPAWNELPCVREERVHLFDGSIYFNRSGPRLVDTLEQVADLVAQWQRRAT